MNAIDFRKFGTAPADQGQIVEHSLSLADGGFVRRIADGATRTCEYFFHGFVAAADRQNDWRLVDIELVGEREKK